MKPILKKTKNGEIKFLSEIYMKEFSKPPYNEKWTAKKALDKMKFFSRFYDLYTIKTNGKIVGFVCINPTFMCPGEVAFGEEMVIDERFQGKGIGTDIIKELFEIYRGRGFKRFMGVADAGGRAIKLYKKLGILPSKKDVLIERRLD